MPSINHEIMKWARETAGLSREAAIEKLEIRPAYGIPALERLTALEDGQDVPSRPMLLKMARVYRRSLLTFYMSAPPRRADRGQDFRTLPIDHVVADDALLDALIRDVTARQDIVRSILQEDEDAQPHAFIGSGDMAAGVNKLKTEISRKIEFDLAEYRRQPSVEDAFALLRAKIEAVGIFVVLIGNLGSYQTAFSVETFRGFALADPIAPFIVINDQDAKSAWAFTLIHELAHLWLGATGVSGTDTDLQIERFCNDLASEFLLSSSELAEIRISDGADLAELIEQIAAFSGTRNLSNAMVAYRLLRAGKISQAKWASVSQRLREHWRRSQDLRKERGRDSDGGPNYYVVKRHRMGQALLQFVSRNLNSGILTPTKAGKVLGVKSRNVSNLLNFTPALRRGSAA